MIYLTARGIGMATTTKEYLKSIRQGDDMLALPDAPVLLSPTRLIESLTREVIRRNPEEFKIECLSNIRSLWPEHLARFIVVARRPTSHAVVPPERRSPYRHCPSHNPFYAGFGNNSNDEMAYVAAGVPPSRIFVINPAGEIRQGGGTYCWASYPRLLELAHEVFPPLDESSSSTAPSGSTRDEPVGDEFKSSNFWRRPLPSLEPPPTPANRQPQEGHQVPCDRHSCHLGMLIAGRVDIYGEQHPASPMDDADHLKQQLDVSKRMSRANSSGSFSPPHTCGIR
eukprot:scaffold41812_cov32-Tisochrysis_lutea.AAC.1